jgi:hypothetical protein
VSRSCARAASGHAAAPPRNVMNSRRLIGSPSGLRPYLTTTWNDYGASEQNGLLMSEMDQKRKKLALGPTIKKT